MKNIKFGCFLTIWLGQFISGIGSGLTAFSMGIFAFNHTKSATAYSLTVLFAFLPAYLLKPIGGALSDRFDRRIMMIIGDLGSALGLMFILLMFFAGIHELWVIYLGVAASSVFVALQNPAYKASLTDLLDEKAYAKGSGLMQLSEAARFVFSPIIAGFLMLILKIEYILMIDIVTFIVAAWLVLAVKSKIKNETREVKNGNLISEIIIGFNYTFSNKGLVWLLLITSVITFTIGFLQALIGPFILSFADAKTLGIAQTISATGMLVSSFSIGIFAKTKKHLKILVPSLLISGVFFGMFGITTNIVIIVATGFVFFASLPFINTSLEVLIRKNVDNAVQGRVWSIVSLISQLGMILAFSIAGFLADRVFNPLLLADGLLASTVGQLIGTGNGRGIGLMFVLSGITIIMTGVAISKNKAIKALELSLSENQ